MTEAPPPAVAPRPVALVADDDPDIRALAGRILQGQGYEVRSACDGSSALELARLRPPDVALLDVAMPGMSGLEVTRALRAGEETRGVPVLLLTTRATEGDVESGLEAGAAAIYIRKPFSPRELTEAVERLGAERMLRALSDCEADARQRAQEGDALHRVAIAVARQPDAQSVIDLVAGEVAGLLGAEIGLVCRFRDGRPVVVGRWGAGPPPAPAVPTQGAHAAARVQADGRAVRVEDGREEAVAAPILIAGAPWGALVALGPRAPRALPPGCEHRLSRFAELVALAVANAESRARLLEEAATDPLTGLANARAFAERLEAETAHAAGEGGELALVVLDIDRFTRINDEHGRPVGDVVLVELAQRMSACVRARDLLARVGGEEFALLLPRTDAPQAGEIAERVRLAVAGRPFPRVGRVTVSAGVGTLAAAGSAADLSRLADLALHRAKAAGRDRRAVPA